MFLNYVMQPLFCGNNDHEPSILCAWTRTGLDSPEGETPHACPKEKYGILIQQICMYVINGSSAMSRV